MKRTPLLALALTVALLMSGCLFSINGFSWSALRVLQGKKVIARISLNPTDSNPTKARVFILVYHSDGGTSDSDTNLNVVTPMVFDKEGKFGGPYTMQKDQALEQEIMTEDLLCPHFAGDFWDDTDDAHWQAVTTTKGVQTHGKFLKKAIAQIGIKASGDAPNGGELVSFYAGAWRDEDGVDGPSEDDPLTCLSSLETLLTIGTPNL
jgi:hypothetical protein